MQGLHGFNQAGMHIRMLSAGGGHFHLDGHGLVHQVGRHPTFELLVYWTPHPSTGWPNLRPEPCGSTDRAIGLLADSDVGKCVPEFMDQHVWRLVWPEGAQVDVDLVHVNIEK